MRLVGGSCSGQLATVVGGGPSLRGFDFTQLKGKSNIIAINAAFKHVPFADACFSEDVRFIEEFGPRLNEFPGHVIWHCLKGIDPERGRKACQKVTIIRELRDDKYWSKDLSSLSFSSNSAVGAINLAEILGCSGIWLLGIDCRAEGMFMENYHTEYPQGWQVTSSLAMNWKSDFEHWVYPNCKVPIMNVINPAYPSTVQCWPTCTLEEYVRAG